MNDPYDLRRFVDAQEPVIDQVYAELGAGRKTTHWMWFVFPQLRGLGSSHMATVFGISSREEAEAYLNHPVLSPRLKKCVELVNAIEDASAGTIFGYPDDMKFRSSMSLFAAIAPREQAFQNTLDKFFAGDPDPLTLHRL